MAAESGRIPQWPARPMAFLIAACGLIASAIFALLPRTGSAAGILPESLIQMPE